MKTAQELRELGTIESVGKRLLDQMLYEIENEALYGKTSYEFLIDNRIPTASIDWAVSEMVALGYDLDDVETDSKQFITTLISW